MQKVFDINLTFGTLLTPTNIVHVMVTCVLMLPSLSMCSCSSGFQSTCQVWSQGGAGKHLCDLEREAGTAGGNATTSHPSGRGGMQHSEGKRRGRGGWVRGGG